MLVEFTYPLALLTSLGLALPFILHLWHKRINKVLVVGTVKYYKEGKRKQIKKWQIKNWPLLLLRCLILLCLSLFLSEPKIAFNAKQKRAEGWILLENGYREGLAEHQKRHIDSLLAQGYELRALQEGFSKIGNKASDTVEDVHDYFGLIRQLDGEVSEGYPVVLYSSSRVSLFMGDPPPIGFQLEWNTFEERDRTAVRWVQRAWQTDQDGINLLVSSSTAMGTEAKIVALERDGNEQGIVFTTEEGTAKVRFSNQANWVRVDQEPFNVQFLAEQGMPDKEYIEAFLEAFTDFTGMPVRLSPYQEDEACDFLFDLRGTEVDDGDYETAKAVFRYGEGNPEEQLGTANKIIYTHFHGTQNTSDLYRLIPANDDARVLWTDVYDQPVLTYVRRGDRPVFNFYSRFNPRWTNMVWSAELINQMLPLLFPESILPAISAERIINKEDQRVYPGTIELPRYQMKANADQAPTPTAISVWFLWLALLLFVAERIWTYQTRKEVDNGELAR